MLALAQSFERFLRLDRLTSKSDTMRARAVYLMGLVFIAAQLVNQVAMYATYGRFTLDNLISLYACGLTFATMLYLRRNKRFVIFAAIYSVLIVAGVFASAVADHVGINTALLPFFVLGIVMNGFISGWRAALVFGGVTLASLAALYAISLGTPPNMIVDDAAFAARNSQRAIQAGFAAIMLSTITAIFAHNMHSAFAELETDVRDARESDAAKTDFLATMSHELFTPLNGIIGLGQVLQTTALDADQAEYTRLIRQCGDDLQGIIANVLLYSQLEAGRVHLDDAALPLRPMLEQALRPHRAAADAKGLTLYLDIADTLPTQARGDVARLRQVVSALVGNAVKFTARGGVRVAVDGAKTAQGRVVLRVCVSDSGPGIAPEYLEPIFAPFTQVDGSITRQHEGTGLGLAVARGLIRLMGGDVTVASELGRGSLFTAVVPLGVVMEETDAVDPKPVRTREAA